MRESITVGYLLILGLSLAEENVSVVTKNGEIIGKIVSLPVNNLTVKRFLGIPYAEPPTANNRFKAPIEVREAWSEPLLATESSKWCVQPLNADMISEDCLYLNVWVPDDANSVSEKLAVMVYVHGGGFFAGSARNYDFGVFSASRDVIVVAMNYRLGPFGFLYLDDVDCPGNMGLRDQDMALKWVKENIDSFGGDREMITIFGHSAGSVSVGYHLLNPNSGDLFQRAILQSGSPYMPFVTDSPKGALDKSLKIAEKVGCGPDADDPRHTIDCLLNITATELLLATIEENIRPFPMADNIFVFDDGFSANITRDKRVLLGSTTDDGALMVLRSRIEDPEKLLKYFALTFTGRELNEEAIELIKFYYYKDHCHRATDHAAQRANVRLFTDFIFTCSTHHLAEELAINDIVVYVYQFAHRPKLSLKPDWVDADHEDEMSFLLGNVFENGDPEEDELATRLMGYWANFAKNGDPNFRPLPEENERDGNETIPYEASDGNATETEPETWPVYSVRSRARLDIDLLRSRLSFDSPRPDHCVFWRRLFHKILTL